MIAMPIQYELKCSQTKVTAYLINCDWDNSGISLSIRGKSSDCRRKRRVRPRSHARSDHVAICGAFCFVESEHGSTKLRRDGVVQPGAVEQFDAEVRLRE